MSDGDSATGAVKRRAGELLKGGAVAEVGKDEYLVESQSEEKKSYRVTEQNGAWKCQCGYHTVDGRRLCKHILAVLMVLEAANRGPRREPNLEPLVVEDPTDPVCPACLGRDCRSRGERDNRYGKSRRYTCRACGKTFTHRPGFLGCHYPDEDISETLDCILRGTAPPKAAEGIKRPDGGEPSGSTLGRWCKKFGGILEPLSKGAARGRVGDDWSTDEVCYHVRGAEWWLNTVMDRSGRYIIEYHHSDEKIEYYAGPLFLGAKKTAGKTPRTMTTDGLVRHPAAVRAMGENVIHIKDAAPRKRHVNNNMHERLNGTLKGMIKRARGFGVERPALHALFIAHYNLIRPHAGLNGMSPAEFLGLEIGTKTGKTAEKIMVAIRHAALHCT